MLDSEKTKEQLIEELQATLNKYKESEERYRFLYNNTPVMLHSIDCEGRLVSVSDYWLETMGYERSEVIGRKSIEFLTPTSQRYATEVVLPEYMKRGYCNHIEYQYVKKNGDIMDALLFATAEKDSSGKFIRSMAVVIDITERKQMEEKLRKLNEELEQRVQERTRELSAINKELEAFSYSVSHDLRTPLRSIDGFSLALLEDYYDKLDETGKDYLVRVRKASQHMSNLIDDLLNLSRVTRSEINFEQVNISNLIETILTGFHEKEIKRQVDFIIFPGITVRGDERLLKIALENLLSNAWKFTSKNDYTKIEFGFIRDEGHIVYFISDNGAGFDMNYANKLFGPFQRFHSTSEFPGTGIGLATVQRIIYRHGGHIWARSKVGEGSVFYFTIET